MFMGTNLILMAEVLAGITVAFALRLQRHGVSGVHVVSGTASFLSGLVTSVLMLVHIGSVLLPADAGNHPVLYDFGVIAPFLFGIAILMPGILSVLLAGALARGELDAQKRTLAASSVVLGLTLPLASFQLPALTIAFLTLFNIATLLCSRTSASGEKLMLSGPAASRAY
jgi:hypothetical protein